MLGFKTDTWNIIELIGKRLPDANESIESARHLPRIRTALGRTRAWLRLAMMKKKLSEYFQTLIDIRETVLKDYYEDFAFIMSDDANILAGLLVGLNSFDYYVYIKDEFLETEPIIDLKYYLKEYNQENGNNEVDSRYDFMSYKPIYKIQLLLLLSYSGINENGSMNVDVLVEQNNYIEEINKHLKYVLNLILIIPIFSYFYL